MSNDLHEEFDAFALTPEMQKHLWEKHIGDGDPRLVVRYSEADMQRFADEVRLKALDDAVNTIVGMKDSAPDLQDYSGYDAWEMALLTAAANVRAMIPPQPTMELVVRGEVVAPKDEAFVLRNGSVIPLEDEPKTKMVLSGFSRTTEMLKKEIDVTHLREWLTRNIGVYFGDPEDADGDGVASYAVNELGAHILEKQHNIHLDADLDWFLETYAVDDDEWDDDDALDPFTCDNCPYCVCICRPKPVGFWEAVRDFFRDLWRVFVGP